MAVVVTLSVLLYPTVFTNRIKATLVSIAPFRSTWLLGCASMHAYMNAWAQIPTHLYDHDSD